MYWHLLHEVGEVLSALLQGLCMLLPSVFIGVGGNIGRWGVGKGFDSAQAMSVRYRLSMKRQTCCALKRLALSGMSQQEGQSHSWLFSVANMKDYSRLFHVC